jgi:hypothetical protein
MVFRREKVSINDDISHYIYILMYTISIERERRKPYNISIEPQPTMKVEIRNRCSGFKLEYQGYFCDGIIWSKQFDKELDASSTSSADLTPFLSTFGGIITYQLQREHVRLDDQPEPPYIWLLVAWKSEGYKKFRVFTHLIEYNEIFKWNRVRLEEYYKRYTNQLGTYTGPIKDRWLLDDGTVLETESKLDFKQRDGVLNIVISEGDEDEHIKSPIRFDPKL